MAESKIRIYPSKEIGTIDPRIYGHFIEHIGGVIYDGVWVGEDSKVPNISGIREDLVEHLRQIRVPIIRWPGGCFADRYHWQDGIGPRDHRPRRYGRWSDVTESNQFGTHEFIKLCRLTAAEPYLAANVGTGTAEEFQQWVEYCNAPSGSTTLADLRRQNGDSEPFNVTNWGVGNESWGCGGQFTPEDYSTEYRKFMTWIPFFDRKRYASEISTPLFVACGPNGNDLDWTRRFFSKHLDYGRKVQLNGWAAHYYCGSTGTALEWTDDQWYELLHKGAYMETLIQDQWNTLNEFGVKSSVKLVIDEWGCWHPSGTEINPKHLYEQMSTLRDAIVAAITLDIFNRHCEKVAMANVAQLINSLHSLFLADGPKFVATPNYYVYKMYKEHQNAKGIQAVFEAPEIEFTCGSRLNREKIPGLVGSASMKAGVLTLTVVNPHVEEVAEAKITVFGGEILEGQETVLTHKNIHAHNTFEYPGELVPRNVDCIAHGSNLTHTFPPASITNLKLSISKS